jgi:hypothetical protein
MFQGHGKGDGIARRIFDRAHEFIPDAVQNGDEVAVFQAQDVQRVVRLAPIEPERVAPALIRRQIKAMHWFRL